jgi:glutathione S-transferase
MKLYSAAYAPKPRRVTMFVAEKGLSDIEIANVDLAGGAQHDPAFKAKNPLAQAPVLELDDGRCLTESRAICGYLEALYPEPNLMGVDPFERAHIEMWDRRVEHAFMLPLMFWVRHGHPAMARVEPNQTEGVATFNQAQAMKSAEWLNGELATRPWIAGERFTIADITAACGVDFAKMMKWRPGEGLPNLARWREAISARPAGQVAP